MSKKRNEELIRVFGGHNYHYHTGHLTKVDAKQRATHLRKCGDRARVVKGPRGWEVWLR